MVDRLAPLPDRETLRLHQANERTFLAWVRTALAMLGFGFVVARFGLFLRELAAAHDVVVVPSGVPWSLWTGLALAALGAITVLVAMVRYGLVSRAIERHEVRRPAGEGWIYLSGVVVVVIAVAIGALLFVAR